MASANSASKKRSIGAPSQQQGSVSCALGKEVSLDVVPLYLEETEWHGEEKGTRLRCKHGLCPARRVAWEGEDTGRRFLGCPLEEDEDLCKFVQWVDPEWDSRVKKTLAGMWDMVDRGVKREASIQADMFKAFALKDRLEKEKNDELAHKNALLDMREAQLKELLYKFASEAKKMEEDNQENKTWFLIGFSSMLMIIVGLIAMLFGVYKM
uniref:GRF+domain+protein n=1 Tax=Oryza glumipatula TaxID=40148 RepID=G8JBE9_9ORYZ|nr:GRF+domain+protein [Oryza glumipatula]